MSPSALRRPLLVRTRDDLQRELSVLRGTGGALALVPTMGSLHEGHLSLMDRARDLADLSVASVFVNPLQFGPGEDLERYPRRLERDFELAAQRGIDLVFAPDPEIMYPDGPPQVRVEPGLLGERLCGRFRPGHFQGVLAVVVKLFGLVRPDVAVFGRKDFQQTVLIRRAVHDLELGVEIEVAPLVRASDGLAMSSRNVHLTPPERREAAGIFRGLIAGQEAFRKGERSGPSIVESFSAVVSGYPAVRLQYAEIVDPETLEPEEEVSEASVLAVAAHCGDVRLIDNIVLGAEEPDPRISHSR